MGWVWLKGCGKTMGKPKNGRKLLGFQVPRCSNAWQNAKNTKHIMESWKEEQLAFYSTQIGIYQMIYTSEIDITGIPGTPKWWFGEDTLLKNMTTLGIYSYMSQESLSSYLTITSPPQCQPWHHRFLPLHVHLPQSPASWGREAPQLQISPLGNWALRLGREGSSWFCMIYQLIPGNTEGSNLQSDTSGTMTGI